MRKKNKITDFGSMAQLWVSHDFKSLQDIMLNRQRFRLCRLKHKLHKKKKKQADQKMLPLFLHSVRLQG